MVLIESLYEKNLYAITGTGGRCFESHRVVGPINGLVQIYLDGQVFGRTVDCVNSFIWD